MSLADFFDRIGNNFATNFDNGGAQGLASLGAAIASAPRNQWGAGLAQGLGQFRQIADQNKKKAALAEALKGATGGLSPQQQAFLNALEPEQQTSILGSQLFKDQPGGPFPGQGFEASVANILARGAKDPEFQKTPEYQLAKADWTKPQFVMGPNGPQIFQRGFPLEGAPAPQPAVPMPTQPPQLRPSVAPPTRPLPPVATDPLAPEPRPANAPMATMEHLPQSTAPTVTALPGGATVTDMGVGTKPTEAQLKAGDYFTRMAGAEQMISNEPARKKYMDWSNWLARRGGDATEWLQGPEAQTYYTAANEFIAALLRKDTGAAVTPAEFALYGPLYIPESGDSPERLAYKAAARTRAREAIRAGLTPDQILKLEKVVADTPNPTLKTDKYPTPPPEAIARLKMARDKASFDEVFGPGAADKYLGGK